jgi:hypothetical protein
MAECFIHATFDIFCSDWEKSGKSVCPTSGNIQTGDYPNTKEDF